MSESILERLRGKFIVLDGVEGAGKGTQFDELNRKLTDLILDSDCDVSVVTAFDPGGTRIGNRIRHVLLDYDLSRMSKQCETLLFMASRAQLVHEEIRSALKKGHIVLCDRYVTATCAYQGAAGVDPKEIIKLAKFATGNVWPSLTIVLDVPVDTGFERTGRSKPNPPPIHGFAKPKQVKGQQMLFKDARKKDAMEARSPEFHQKVRELFLDLPSYYPAPVTIVDGTGSIEEVHVRVLEAIEHAAL